MKLPNNPKTVLLLYYVEGYKVDEIATILHIKSGSILPQELRSLFMFVIFL